MQNLLVCLAQSTRSSQSDPKDETSRTLRTWREIYSRRQLLSLRHRGGLERPGLPSLCVSALKHFNGQDARCPSLHFLHFYTAIPLYALFHSSTIPPFHSLCNGQNPRGQAQKGTSFLTCLCHNSARYGANLPRAKYAKFAKYPYRRNFAHLADLA